MESGYPPFQPNNSANNGERTAGFKNGFGISSEMAMPNNFAAQAGFNNELNVGSSSFDPSAYNMSQWNLMSSATDLNLASLDQSYLNSVNNMHMMDPNFFYNQNQGMTLPMSMAMPFSLGMGTGGMMPPQMMMGANNFAGPNFGQFGSVPASNNGFQPQTLAQNPKMISNHALQASFQPTMNGMYIPSNAPASHANPQTNAALSRSGAMHQQNDLNPQQSMNFYMSPYPQAFSNQMPPNFNLGIPNPQKMEMLAQQASLAPHQAMAMQQQAVSMHQQHVSSIQQQLAARAHQQPALTPQQHTSASQHFAIYQQALQPAQRSTPVHQQGTPSSQRSTPIQQSTPVPQRVTPPTPRRAPSTPMRTPTEASSRPLQPTYVPIKVEPNREASLPAKPPASDVEALQPKSPQWPSPFPEKPASQRSTPLQLESPNDESPKAATPASDLPRTTSGSVDKEQLRQRCLASRSDFYSILNAITNYVEDPKSPVMFMDTPIDLHVLWSSIIEVGGPVECGKSKSWAKIRERLGLDCAQSKVPNRLKCIWRRHLLTLESFLYPDHAPVLDSKKRKSDSVAPKATVKLESIERRSLVESPAASSGSPEEPSAKKLRYEPPPRTQPYDYVPLVIQPKTVGGVDVAQLHAGERPIPDYPGGEISISSLSMALSSRMSIHVSQALNTLLKISSSTHLLLDGCSRLTETLLELVKEDFSSLFPSPPLPNNLSYESLSRKFYEEGLGVRSKITSSTDPTARIMTVFAILRNLSITPENQQHLAKQTDLVCWFFLVVHSLVPKDNVSDLLELRKHLLMFLSNILGHWIIDKDALKPTSRLPAQLPPQLILDFICEFLPISGSHVYPSLALECLAKLTTLDSHRVLLAAPPLASRCSTTLNTLAELLQSNFIDESEPIDEAKIVYIQHLLMSISNLIDILGEGCDFPKFLPETLIRSARLLARLEVFERGLKETRNGKLTIPNPGSYMNRLPLSKQERLDILVRLAVRALNALKAIFCLPSSQDSVHGGSNLLVLHRGTLVELLTIPSIDVTLTTLITTILNPVGNILCPPS